MDAQKVDMFIITNSSKLPAGQIPIIRDYLLKMDDSKGVYLQAITFKDPVVILIVSLFFGCLGVDRFLIGDIGLGVGKLLTLGGCGIWSIVDWFLIMEATKKKNMIQLQTMMLY